MSQPADPDVRHRSDARGENGTTTIGTAAGVLVFLVFLLFAIQLLMALYATSTVSAASQDAARRVASMHVDHRDPRAVRAATGEAEAQLRQLLGAIGDEAQIDWSVDDEVVRLHIVTEAPAILPSGIRDTSGLRRIDRTITVRIEEPSR